MTEDDNGARHAAIAATLIAANDSARRGRGESGVIRAFGTTS